MNIAMHKAIQDTTTQQGLRIVSYAMTSDGAVTLLVSFLGGDTFAPRGKGTLADMTAALVDTGTKSYTKEQLRDRIESLGASVHFYSRGNRVHGSIRALYKDLPKLLPLVVEELHTATFTNKEIAIVQKQLLAQCEEDKSETGTLALQKLSSFLYPKAHPNYILSITERMESIRSVTRKDLQQFYATYYGLNAMHCVLVGDIDTAATSVIQRQLQKLPIRSLIAPPRPAVPKTRSQEAIVPVKDKMTVDVVLGHELAFTRDHVDYYPFMIGMEILGAGFTGHLMQTVRERDGLTYFIRAGLSGFGEHDQGNWFVRSQFAPSLYTKGVQTIRRELEIFLDTVMTDERIEARKRELIGSYAVSLGSTHGVAARILRLCDESRSLAEIDTYADTIASVTPESVRSVVRKHMQLDRISIVSAGSIDQKGNPL
jgi:zinc protease